MILATQEPFRSTDNTIWLLDARKVAPPVVLALNEVLSDSSRAVRARYVRDAARNRFTVSRALLRHAVAQFARCDVEDVIITERPESAPRVEVTDHAAVHISLSHSGSWIACATSAHPVGLDVECTNTSRDLTAMSEWFYTPDEHQWVVRHGDPSRIEAFYRLWTGKESVFKLACSVGWHGALSDVHFAVTDNTLGAPYPIQGIDVHAAFQWIRDTVACSVATRFERHRVDDVSNFRVEYVDSGVFE